MKHTITAILIFAAGAAGAEAPANPDAQLRQNFHDIRIAIERADADARAKAQGSTIGLFLNRDELSSIPQMRRDMADAYRNMVEVRPPCMGAEVNVNDGQAILICGDNNGLADNENFESQDTYNIDESVTVDDSVNVDTVVVK